MNQAIPCPYCGHVGYHMWAGGGGCPGAVPERERDAAVAVYLQTLNEQNRNRSAEIERLKALVKDRMYEFEDINELKSLLSRAADALEKYGLSDDQKDLIAELRKAAQ